MSVIMSDMKTKPAAKKSAKRSAPPVRDTFTVRELNREPQLVLTAARKLGEVHVHSRSGERFIIKPEAPTPNVPNTNPRDEFHNRLKMLHSKLRAAGQGFTTEGWDTFGKMLAGEQ